MKRVLMKFTFAVCLLALASMVSAAPRTAFVHLFEWQWTDVASECENHLGPNGFSAVQVSPPQKSISGSQWWTRYQPVSYAIEGRSGTRAEFENMVDRCNAAGVDVYVDAVINHMAAWDRNFPEVPYGPNDFHSCTSDIDYSNAWSVQNCDLVGLNDLATESDYVRGKIAAYMNDLIGMGVAGFRIDAAKHIPASDIANIVGRLNGSPYVFQEVIGAANEPIQPGQYTYIADVTEFNFERTIGHYFKGRGPLADLVNIGTWGGWLNSSDAVVFVANHDDQRQHTYNTLTHMDGMDLYELGHVFMLAYPYGYPKVMSSYAFSSHDQAPPTIGASTCSNGWICEHRNRAIANMVGFRNATNSAFYVSNWWDNGNNQIAFGRGGLGFVVINRENSGTLFQTLPTGMPEGIYCDVINGDFSNGVCNGPTISVDSAGNASFNVNAFQAAAVHVEAKVTDGGGGDPDPQGCNYSSMNLRGTFNSWGSQAMTCSGGTWTTTATFSADGRFKFDAYGDWSTNFGDNNDDGRAEQGGGDINIGADTYTITFNDSNMAYSVTASGGGGTGSVSVSFTCNNGYTYSGQSVYVVGDIAELGNWNPANAQILSPTNYPSWTGDIQLPANTNVEWKCVKRDESDPNAGVEWQGGGNNLVNTGSGTSASASF